MNPRILNLLGLISLYPTHMTDKLVHTTSLNTGEEIVEEITDVIREERVDAGSLLTTAVIRILILKYLW
jgi:hypothetical protein